MSEIVGTLGSLIIQAMMVYRILIFIYILSSWVPSMRENAFGQFLGKIVDPYLAIFRNIIPPFGMIDISPIIAIIALSFIESGVRTVFNIILSML